MKWKKLWSLTKGWLKILKKRIYPSPTICRNVKKSLKKWPSRILGFMRKINSANTLFNKKPLNLCINLKKSLSNSNSLISPTKDLHMSSQSYQINFWHKKNPKSLNSTKIDNKCQNWKNFWMKKNRKWWKLLLKCISCKIQCKKLSLKSKLPFKITPLSMR